MFLDVIIFAIIAAVILLKFYNLLGTQNEVDLNLKKHHNLKDEENKSAELNKSKVNIEEQKLLDQLSETHKQKILKLKELYPVFQLQKFYNNVEKAFETVIKAFDDYDIEAIEFLTDKDAKDNFLKNIKQLKEKSEEIHIDVVSMNHKEIKDIKISRNEVQITVNFITEQIFYSKDNNGNLKSGDLSRIEEISDNWVFHKNLKDSSPVWKLISTNG